MGILSSAEAGKHAKERGNINYRDKGPKGSTDRGKQIKIFEGFVKG